VLLDLAQHAVLAARELARHVVAQLDLPPHDESSLTAPRPRCRRRGPPDFGMTTS
jgi:hypothetical protein